MKNRGARFLQSPSDFPCTVELGGEVPAWGISRWDRWGLRFLPDDDEGFTLRGDGRQLLYRGRRRSHRFTILGDERFEYDCILHREPESNVVSLVIEGAEGFDFFRQPDWLKNPLYAGSYAVYRKETPIGEGTGKLCHIHRPEIIDASGRRVWGDLSVSGDRLCITIPQDWLSHARYPVVVDPVIGTSTVGSQYLWDNDDPGEPMVPLMLEMSVTLNRFLVQETIDGPCTAYAYTNQDYDEAGGRPVLYSDNDDYPQYRRSAGEGLFDFRVGTGKPKGWRSAGFASKERIEAGAYIWFGVFGEYYWFPRFDWGAECYDCMWYDWQDDPVIFEECPDDYYFRDFKLSMYFNYTSAKSYVRTLTQGVSLSDSRKVAASYKRVPAMTAQGITLLGRASAYYREHAAAFTAADSLSRIRGFFRTVTEELRISGITNYCRDFLRSITNTVRPSATETRKLDVKRDVSTEAGTQDSTARERGFIRTLLMAVTAQDSAGKMFNWFRSIRHEAAAFDQTGHLGDYLRGLYSEAGSMAGTKHKGEYYRLHQDTVATETLSLRHLIIFIRLVTVGFIRDYLIPRFLRSKEEVVLKSAVSREIELDSRIH